LLLKRYFLSSLKFKEFFTYNKKEIEIINLLIFLFYFSFVLRLVLFLIAPLIQPGFFLTRKRNRLEAGFYSSGKTHISFSLQFLLLLLVFILFDTELLFTFGIITNNIIRMYINMGVILFLYLTLLFEWKIKKLHWLL
jgi:NADH:ubiquinone oxidoreductase subunit 3 (subunit A)